MALWILLLAAALAGILMMRVVSGSREVASERRLLVQQASEESALQEAAAELLFAPPGSAQGEIVVGPAQRAVTIAYSSESRRIDANEAPIDVLTEALLASGIDRALAARVIAAIEQRRLTGRRWVSLGQLMASVPPGHGACLAELLTVHGGRTGPLPTADGGAAVSLVATRQAAMRLRIGGDGEQRTIIVRPALGGASPMSTLELLRTGSCARGS
ncbi:MAG: hypothetical protein K2X31_10825 [Sphingopyxis sp.]|nr:hypothetical protein [Sphingopyxis sp.]